MQTTQKDDILRDLCAYCGCGKAIMTPFTLTVQKEKESDSLFLQLPDETMRELDWREGDALSWILKGDGGNVSVILENVSLAERKASTAAEIKLYEVQVLVTHRVRYAVNAASAKEAAAAVMKGDCDVEEFDQNCLGTQVVCSRGMSMAQYLVDPGHVGPDESKMALIHDAS